MRFTVSPEQHKFFHLKGYLSLDHLLSTEEGESLIQAMLALRTKSPGYPDENCFRAIPLIVTLARKRGWGRLVCDLIHKQPLRIAYDTFFSTAPTHELVIDEDSCGLLVNLISGSGCFFRKTLPSELYAKQEGAFFLIVFTTKFLPDQLNPVIVQ